MPDAAELHDFISLLEHRLEAPLNAYFDVVDKVTASPSGFFGDLIGRLSIMRASSQLRADLLQVIADANIVSGVYGNDSKTLNAAQMQVVQDAISEQQGFLLGFLAEVDRMGRSQALSRIRRYVSAIIQTLSRVAVYGLPRLPHYPGDRDLACHGFCKCHLRIVPKGNGNWDVYWIVDPEAEHCIDCREIARAWNPLLIRQGQIVESEKVAA